MGRNNQQRRRAKAKARRQQASAGRRSREGEVHSANPGAPQERLDAADRAERLARGLIDEAIMARGPQELEVVADRLRHVADSHVGARAVVRVAGRMLHEMIGAAWEGGWEPADLHRFIGRKLTSIDQDHGLDLMVDDLAGYAESTVDPRWRAQLDELGASAWWPAGSTWLSARIDASAATTARSVVALTHLFARLATLEPVGAPPGRYIPPRDAVAKVDERILSRVRALLAKAESTTFEAEAETFTAGAQSLMARHSIDAAVLAADDSRDADAPAARRIGIDPPYESAKVSLLAGIADANRCRTVWSKELGFATVLGFEADLDATETLFTSLLVQSTKAVAREGRRTHAGGRSRTRSFRQSFLASFAQRISERLRETRDQALDDAVADAGSCDGRELVPLMAARSEAVDEAVDAMFPELTRARASVATDAEGWASGRRAADQAALNHGEALRSASG